jgi:hypothetical protein
MISEEDLATSSSCSESPTTNITLAAGVCLDYEGGVNLANHHRLILISVLKQLMVREITLPAAGYGCRTYVLSRETLDFLGGSRLVLLAEMAKHSIAHSPVLIPADLVGAFQIS